MRACANIRQEAWRVLARLADIRQPVLLGLAKLAEIRELFCSDSPDSPTLAKGHFKKNVTCLAKFARVFCKTCAKFASSHCLVEVHDYEEMCTIMLKICLTNDILVVLKSNLLIIKGF